MACFTIGEPDAKTDRSTASSCVVEMSWVVCILILAERLRTDDGEAVESAVMFAYGVLISMGCKIIGPVSEKGIRIPKRKVPRNATVTNRMTAVNR